MTTIERAKKVANAYANLVNEAVNFATKAPLGDGTVSVFRVEELAEAAVKFTQTIENLARGDRPRRRR